MTVIEDRRYQVDAVDNVSKKWREGFRRVLLVMATGAGKTTCAAMAIMRAVRNGKRCLVVAHRRNLIKQIAERLAQFGIRYSVVMANLPDEPWVRVDPAPAVWIASRDTMLSLIGAGGWDPEIQPDLLFGDEAHRIDEDSYTKLLQKCPARYWLGLTATPIRPDGAGLGKKNWDAIVCGATVAEMVAQKVLVPLHVYCPPGVARRRAAGKKVRVSGDPVEEWLKHASGKRTIAFLPSVAEARSVTDAFNAAGVPAAILSAKSSNEERADILGRVRDGKILWLGNVDLFTEGMDLPELEACQVLRQMESLRQYIQCVGRVLRAAPWVNKTHAILLDHSGCSAKHRYPEIEPEWRLDESGEQFEARHKARIEKELGPPVECRGCGAVFAGTPSCPHCGWAIPPSRKRKPMAFDAEGLEPAGRAATAAYVSPEQRAWDKVLWAARFKGMTCGMAHMMFRKKTRKTPREAGVRPLFGFDQKDLPVAEAEGASRSYSGH